ncbi:MAG: L-rhamnose mutarotase, partial [Arenibacter sp.]|nr:L-rhamnose mutarotase [Arenibacter sp.]
TFEKKALIDAKYPENEKWEELMWQYQQALPMAKPGEKWMLMEKVFRL